jgi:hypothetical protein
VKEKAVLSWRIVLDSAEQGVAKQFVETWSLKAESIEPRTDTPAPDRLHFSLPHERGADSRSAVGFRDKKQLNTEPFPSRSAPKAAHGFARTSISDQHRKRSPIMRPARSTLKRNKLIKMAS